MKWLVLVVLAGCSFDCNSSAPTQRPTSTATVAPSGMRGSPAYRPPVPVVLRVTETDRVMPDLPARALAESCDQGDMDDCLRLARAYQSAELGLDEDVGSARRLFRRACNDAALGCSFAAQIDPEEATAYLERGCSAGDSRSCDARTEL